MKYENIKVAMNEAVATVTLNRPQIKNALSVALRDEFRHFIAEESGTLHAVILTSAGDAFCSGMDLSERGGEDVIREMWTLMQAIYESDAVFIAAVNGIVRGAGLTFINACDFAIADPEATFGIPETKHGFYGPAALPTTQLVAAKKLVAEMALSGDVISAERAAQGFLINKVAKAGALLEEARDLALRLTKMNRTTLAIVKRGLNALPYDAALRDQGIEMALDLNRTLFKDKPGGPVNQTGKYKK